MSQAGAEKVKKAPKAWMGWRDDTLKRRLREAIRLRPRLKKNKKNGNKPKTPTPDVVKSTGQHSVRSGSASSLPHDILNNVGTSVHQVGSMGSILALRPREPLALDAATSVSEACKHMESHCADCVLVLDAEGAVCGIFTARDVALMVVGEGKDASKVRIEDIMARDPAVAQADASALEALDLMASQSIRHLPVVAADDAGPDAGAVLGILDISRCMAEAAAKLDSPPSDAGSEVARLARARNKNVQTDSGTSYAPPSLADVLATAGDSAHALSVDSDASALSAAKLMREHNTTAVLVADAGQISGIVTSEDIVMRVLAVGLDPAQTNVVRVMTSHPDAASITDGVHDALRCMNQGGFLNLPVLGSDGTVVGVVDALTLAYVALAHLRSLACDTNEEPWNRFWLSLEASEDDSSFSQTPAESPARNVERPTPPASGLLSAPNSASPPSTTSTPAPAPSSTTKAPSLPPPAKVPPSLPPAGLAPAPASVTPPALAPQNVPQEAVYAQEYASVPVPAAEPLDGEHEQGLDRSKSFDEPATSVQPLTPVRAAPTESSVFTALSVVGAIAAGYGIYVAYARRA